MPLDRVQTTEEVRVARLAQTALDAALADRHDLDLTPLAREWLLGQAWAESRFGASPDWRGSNNWGGVVYHKGDGKFVVHGDRDAQGDPTTPRFQAYDTQAEAAADFLAIATRTSAEVDALERGTVHDYAEALYAAGYYTGTTGTPADRVIAYTSMLLQGAAHVRTLLANADLQDLLNERGADPVLVVDGVVGPKTKAAVSAFQRASGLPETGIADTVTLAALRTWAPPPEDPPCS